VSQLRDTQPLAWSSAHAPVAPADTEPSPPTRIARADRGEGSHDPGLAALSAAITQLVRSHGRHPTGASSWRFDERCVVTALLDFMTPAENALVKAGDCALVRQLRSAFAEAIADEYLRAAERALQREVIAHHSELVCDSGICLEIFLLASHRRIPPEHRPGAPLPRNLGAG
jgi:hypothetical protein